MKPALGVVVLLVLAASPLQAQEFSLLLKCGGTFEVPGQGSQPAYSDFALRYNNRSALIQRSNVLPVGERLDYVPTPTSYTMTYRLPVQGTRIVVLPGWFYHTLLALDPDLRRLNQIRVSIDRQTGALEGVVLNEQQQPLTTFAMQCESSTPADTPPPKF